MKTIRPGREGLRELVIDLALSVTDLAKAAGCSRAALYDLMDGRWMPRPILEKRIAEAAGVPRSRVLAACRESCRRAGNLDVVRR